MALVDKDGHLIGTPPVISIAIPTHDMVPAYWAYDAMNMVMHTVQALPPGTQFGVSMFSGTYIHCARQELLETLLEQGNTHILWLDSDMRFPRDAIGRLLLHNKDFVGINYATRGVPSNFVGIKEFGVPGKTLETNKDSTGLEKVDALGFGLFLMKTEPLLELPEKPWFWYDNELGSHVGEDVYFCRILRDMGHTIYVDHDLSKVCGHVGPFEYKTQLIGA